MSQPPFFSVVTPTYNRAEFLPEMISSVLAQSFTDFEHIIVDDGSTDDSESLVKSIADHRIRYIKQENKGRSTARNTGTNAATGQFICFLDSDDVWLPEHLQSLKNTITKQQTPAFYITGLVWFFDDGQPDEVVQYRPRHLYTSDCEFVITNQFAPNCVCLPSEAAKKHLFNESLSVNEDLELWARVAADLPVIEVKAATAKLRVHEGNTSNQIKDTITPRRKVLNMVFNNPSVIPHLSAAFVADRKRGLDENAIRDHQAAGRRWLYIWSLIKFLIKHPNNPSNKAKLLALLRSLPGGNLLKQSSG